MKSGRYGFDFGLIFETAEAHRIMKNPRAKKSFKTLADRLKAIRRRPLSQSDVDDLNRTFEEIKTKLIPK